MAPRPRRRARARRIPQRASRAKDDGHIFLDDTGTSYEARKLAQTFRRDLQRANVKRAQLFERTRERMPLRLQDLRATFTTLALANGKSESRVQPLRKERLGRPIWTVLGL